MINLEAQDSRPHYILLPSQEFDSRQHTELSLLGPGIREVPGLISREILHQAESGPLHHDLLLRLGLTLLEN